MPARIREIWEVNPQINFLEYVGFIQFVLMSAILLTFSVLKLLPRPILSGQL